MDDELMRRILAAILLTLALAACGTSPKSADHVFVSSIDKTFVPTQEHPFPPEETQLLLDRLRADEPQQAQMMQAIVNDVHHSSGGGGCSPNGCSGDLATAGGGLTLFGCWSTWACTAAVATANGKLFGYSCPGGSPSTGDVLATTGTGAPNTTAMDTGCSGHTITVTKFYNQGTATTWDMDNFGPLAYTASCANSNPCVGATGGNALRTTNNATLGALPLSLSGVLRGNNTGSIGTFLVADQTTDLEIGTNFPSSQVRPYIGNPTGSSLTASNGGSTTDYLVTNAVVLSTSACTIDVIGTSTGPTGCGTNTHGSGSKAGFNLSFGGLGFFTEFFVVQGDFSANIANLRASQCTRWRGSSC